MLESLLGISLQRALGNCESRAQQIRVGAVLRKVYEMNNLLLSNSDKNYVQR